MTAMNNYTLTLTSLGEQYGNFLEDDQQADEWARTLLVELGHDPDLITDCGWWTENADDDGNRLSRNLYWQDPDAAADDDGAQAIASLEVTRCE
jgi:hypothetical protein